MTDKDELAARIVELLERSLAIEMYSLGIRQTHIARTLGKSPNWVNALLKGFPRRERD